MLYTHEILGGKRVLGPAATSAFAIDALIRAGLPAQALATFKARTHFTNREIAQVLGVSEKTLERTAAAEVIRPSASDRLYRLARIVELAVEVLCDEQQALAWLREPEHGLGERVPLELLGTDAGAEQVKAELMRIRYGFLA